MDAELIPEGTKLFAPDFHAELIPEGTILRRPQCRRIDTGRDEGLACPWLLIRERTKTIRFVQLIPEGTNPVQNRSLN